MKDASHTNQIPNLRRIEGQIKGIQTMVEDGKYCVDILNQIKATIVPLANTGYPIFHISEPSLLNNLIILIGTITGLLYFFFSKEQTGNFGKLTRVGIYFLMISFGASFGFAVMGRISLLIGRFVDLITYSKAEHHHATLWILVIMVIILAYSAFMDSKKPKNDNI